MKFHYVHDLGKDNCEIISGSGFNESGKGA